MALDREKQAPSSLHKGTLNIDMTDYEYIEQLAKNWGVSSGVIVRVFIRNNTHKLPACKEAAILEHKECARRRFAARDRFFEERRGSRLAIVPDQIHVDQREKIDQLERKLAAMNTVLETFQREFGL